MKTKTQTFIRGCQIQKLPQSDPNPQRKAFLRAAFLPPTLRAQPIKTKQLQTQTMTPTTRLPPFEA